MVLGGGIIVWLAKLCCTNLHKKKYAYVNLYAYGQHHHHPHPQFAENTYLYIKHLHSACMADAASFCSSNEKNLSTRF